MTQHRIHHGMYWSNQHAALLYAMAEKVMDSQFQRRSWVDPDDLVNTAWLRALRHRPADRLRGCATYVRKIMHEQLRYVILGRSDWVVKHHPAEPVAALDELIDFEAVDPNPGPLEMAIRHEEEWVRAKRVEAFSV